MPWDYPARSCSSCLKIGKTCGNSPGNPPQLLSRGTEPPGTDTPRGRPKCNQVTSKPSVICLQVIKYSTQQLAGNYSSGSTHSLPSTLGILEVTREPKNGCSAPMRKTQLLLPPPTHPLQRLGCSKLQSMAQLIKGCFPSKI